jgi:hypothetical protein
LTYCLDTDSFNCQAISDYFLLYFDADSKKGAGMGVPGGGSGGHAAQDLIGALQNLTLQGIFRSTA